jgi:hypothetical protein
VLKTVRPGYAVIAAAGRRDPRPVLLAEREKPWQSAEVDFLRQVAQWAALAYWADRVHGDEVRMAQTSRKLRTAGLRQLVEGDLAAARRTLKPVAPDLVDAGAGVVAIVDGAPGEGPATLTAAIDRAAGGMALIVPMAEWKPARRGQRESGQVIVIYPLGAGRLDSLLDGLVQPHSGRTAGVSAVTPWRRLDVAIDAASAAWKTARSDSSPLVRNDGRAPLPELLGADAGDWATRLLQGLQNVTADETTRAQLLRITENALWWGDTEAARQMNIERRSVGSCADSVASAVGLDRTNQWHAAALYLAVRLGSLPPPVVPADREVTLHEALRHDDAQEWADSIVGRLAPEVRAAVTAWLSCHRDPEKAAEKIGVSRTRFYEYLTTARQVTGLEFTKYPGPRSEMTLALLITDRKLFEQALQEDAAFRQVAAPDPRNITIEPDELVIDTTKAHSARVYDYFLGGKTNFLVDRQAAARIRAINRHTRFACRECRSWVNRAIRWIVRQGVNQIIDLGTGIPTSPNIHETAQSIDRYARVLYFDHDPIVLQHARALLESTEEGRTAYIQGDFYDGAALLDQPQVGKIIDLSQPAALCLNSLTHFVPDDDAYDLVASLVRRLAPGSMLMMTQLTTEFDADLIGRVIESVSTDVTPAKARSFEEFSRFFDGLDLVEPGIVCPPEWGRAPGAKMPAFATVNALAAVARIVR